MADTAIQEKAAKAMVAINAAIRNMRLYPITSTATISSVEKAFQGMAQIFETEEILAFAESERSLLICGQPLSEKEQQKPHTIAFLDLLLSFGIRNIAFQKGISRDELIAFMESLISRPEDIAKKGGLKAVVAEKKLPHIIIDEKVFVSVDEDQQIASKNDVNKKVNIEETFAPMVSTLDTVLDTEYKDKVSRHLAASMVKKDDQVLGAVLTQKTEGELGEKLFAHIIEAIDDEKFERLIFVIRQMFEEVQKDVRKSSDAEIIRQAYQNMLKSDKGERFQAKIREKREQEKAQQQEYKAKLLAGLGSLLKGEKSAFEDKEVMKTLPTMIVQMLSQKQNKSVDMILDRLCDGLNLKTAAVRANVAEALASSLEKLPDQTRKNTITRLTAKLANWISRKTALTPAVEKIAQYLAEKAADLLVTDQFVMADQILKAFNTARYGKIDKEPNFRDFIGKILKAVANDDVMNRLLREFRLNEENKRDQAGRTMTFMGEFSAAHLLDILKESQYRSERARILQLISDMGPAALPVLMERIQEGKPWYFMRNLVLLFGKAGNESHLEIIRPFLSHEDYRVQREALNSIYTIGGQHREEIFLSVLLNVGDQLKSDIVGMLGAMECKAAIPQMLQILEAKSLLTSKFRNDLEEKICNVLGNLMAGEAIQILMAISEPKKGILTKKSYSEKVQEAAQKALQKIRAGRTK